MRVHRVPILLPRCVSSFETLSGVRQSLTCDFFSGRPTRLASLSRSSGDRLQSAPAPGDLCKNWPFPKTAGFQPIGASFRRFAASFTAGPPGLSAHRRQDKAFSALAPLRLPDAHVSKVIPYLRLPTGRRRTARAYWRGKMRVFLAAPQTLTLPVGRGVSWITFETCEFGRSVCGTTRA